MSDAPGPTTPPSAVPRRTRGDLRFGLAVLVAYVTAALVAALLDGTAPDLLMRVAESALHGHLDSDALKGGVDTVYFNGHYYFAQGPAQLAAYMPFAAIPALEGIGRFAAPLLFGIPAAWISLPLARRFGAAAGADYWIATFVAFGSLLFYVSTVGDSYYLAHTESVLALMAFLLEWKGKRRSLVLGALLGFAFLARSTVIVAALPFGLALLWDRRRSLRSAFLAGLSLGIPIALALLIFCWYNWLRFGSFLETGYAISYLSEPSLVAARSQGLFSLAHVPQNLWLLVAAPPNLAIFVPVASRWGMSMLLVSPGLLLALKAGIHSSETKLLWLTALLIALPVLTYYGGGFVQYGFRYSLDFTPFLVALMAIGARSGMGRWAKGLIVWSAVSVSYGVLLDVAWHHYT